MTPSRPKRSKDIVNTMGCRELAGCYVWNIMLRERYAALWAIVDSADMRRGTYSKKGFSKSTYVGE
jgi:hypothetical protein